jgi:hypothetical protein
MDYIDQLYLITDVIGNPPEVMEKITSKNARHIVDGLSQKEPRQLRDMLNHLDGIAHIYVWSHPCHKAQPP